MDRPWPGVNRRQRVEMNSSPSENEVLRLAALRRYAVLDTPPERDFDELAGLASQICGTPIALMTLIDERRQWFKAAVGLEQRETPREYSFCAQTLQSPDVMVVPDAREDARFAGNPLVTGEPGIRFYAGAPLVTPDGQVLGALCVIDRVPRQLQAEQLEALRTLSREIVAQL